MSRYTCTECDEGTFRVSDAIYAECDNCHEEIERNEIEL